MFLCSLIEELCTKEENDKTGCNFNFGHECRKKFCDGHTTSLASNTNDNPITLQYSFKVEEALFLKQSFAIKILLDLYVLMPSESENGNFTGWPVCLRPSLGVYLLLP